MNLKKAILLLNVFITALILWILGSIVFTWASNLGSKSNIKETVSKPKQPPTTIAVLTKDLKEFELIVKKDIFKTPEDTSGAASVNKGGANKQQTSLNLKLRGTVVGENNASYAIIFDGSTGKEDLYELNATIQGARIQEILADRVILNINGKEEALILPIKKSGGSRQAHRPLPKRYRPPKTVKKPPKKVAKPKNLVRPFPLPGNQ